MSYFSKIIHRKKSLFLPTDFCSTGLLQEMLCPHFSALTWKLLVCLSHSLGAALDCFHLGTVHMLLVYTLIIQYLSTYRIFFSDFFLLLIGITHFRKLDIGIFLTVKYIFKLSTARKYEVQTISILFWVRLCGSRKWCCYYCVMQSGSDFSIHLWTDYNIIFNLRSCYLFVYLTRIEVFISYQTFSKPWFPKQIQFTFKEKDHNLKTENNSKSSFRDYILLEDTFFI